MMRYLVLVFLLMGCNRHDDARDKEIAVLKAEIAALKKGSEATPSLGAVPPPASPAAKGDEGSPRTAKPLEFLLKRIASEKQKPEALTTLVAEAQEAENRAVRYAHLEKNADRYIGRPWSFSGRIIQIDETSELMSARVALDYFGNKIMMVFGRFETNFVKGDYVDVVGYLAGTFSYESQAKWQITIPAIAAEAMLKGGAIKKMVAQQRRTVVVGEE